MKKLEEIGARKHGLNARMRVCRDSQTHQAGPGARHTVTLAFDSQIQTYLWITDRGRSRLVKH